MGIQELRCSVQGGVCGRCFTGAKEGTARAANDAGWYAYRLRLSLSDCAGFSIDP
jgi:hypothetical protein